MAGTKVDEMKEKKASKTARPSWVKMKKDELEKIVVDLARDGKTPAQIGLILRDKYGVPKARLFGKKITHILGEREVEYKSEKEDIERRVENLKRHISENKKDYPASRALTKNLWVVHKARN